MKLTAIDKAFGVAESTGQGKAKAIRDLLKIRQFDFRWMLRAADRGESDGLDDPGQRLHLDARRLKREVQEEAFRKGLIPYIPGEQPARRRGNSGVGAWRKQSRNQNRPSPGAGASSR